jgi:hypothetical protein
MLLVCKSSSIVGFDALPYFDDSAL